MKMQLRYLVTLWLIGALLISTGCDPKKMIEEKVPDAVKNVMVSGKGGSQKGKSELKGQADRIELTILTPKRNSVHPVNEPIVFEARVKMPAASPKSPPKAKVSWKLYRGTALKGGKLIDSGKRVTKRLIAGRYKVSAILRFGKLKKVKTTAFRVANTIEGRLTDNEGTALPHVELLLSKIDEDKVLHKAQSGKDGKFTIEIPSDGFFKLIPQKKGYSFFPYCRIVKFTDPPVFQNFKGTKAQITDIRITDDPNGDNPVTSVCPLQQSYVSFAIKSDFKPVSVEAYLVGVKDGKEQIIQMEDASEDSAVKQKIHPEGTVLKLQIPSTMATGIAGTKYRLRLTVQDEKNNQFSAETPESLDYDIVTCFRQSLAHGVELQKKGKLEAAVKTYRLLEKLNKKVDDPSQFRSFMEQSTFNRGLAFLAMAMTKPKDETDHETLLFRAASDFDTVLGHDAADFDARLFMGLTLQLAGANRRAIRQYSKIIEQEPQYPGTRELRALARLKLVEENLKQIKKDFKRFGKEDIRELFSRLEQRGILNHSDTAVLKSGSSKTADRVNVLLKAINRLQKKLVVKLLAVVDDFTAAIKSHPEDKSLRRSRREALRIVFDLENSEVDQAKFRADVRRLLRNESAPPDLDHPAFKISISNIPRRDASKVVDVGKYVRE